jgi:hypothetical protein
MSRVYGSKRFEVVNLSIGRAETATRRTNFFSLDALARREGRAISAAYPRLQGREP